MFDIHNFVHEEFEYVVNYGSPTTDLRVDCPFCTDRYGSDDTKQKLYISTRKQVVHCFRCGYKASWIRFIMDVTGMPYYHAIGRLNSYSLKSFGDIDSLFHKQNEIENSRHERTRNFLPDGFIPLTTDRKLKLVSSARKYLEKRQFGIRAWKRYNLGVSSNIGYRVIIPVEDTYYQARALYDFIQPKYLNPKAEAKHYIFNSIALSIYEEVIITEGCFSAMAVGDNAVAILGKEAPTEKLERLVSSQASKFIIALDAGAVDFSMKIADRISAHGKEVRLWLYEEGDPADNEGYTQLDYNFKEKVRFLMTSSRKSH